MKDEPLPGSDHVVRYCGGSSLDEHGQVSGASFKLKPKADGSLDKL